MSYSETQSLGSGGSASRDSASIEVLVRRIRLALGVGLVLLLVAFAAIGERSAPDYATDASFSQTVIDPGTEFDGRGKWGGYAN